MGPDYLLERLCSPKLLRPGRGPAPSCLAQYPSPFRTGLSSIVSSGYAPCVGQLCHPLQRLRRPGAGSSRISPKQKQPKKALQQIAHRTSRSWWAVLSQDCLIWQRREGVIGNLTLGGTVPSRERLIPAWTLRKTGKVDCSLGSGRPRAICMLLTPARYDLIVWGARFWSAAKQHSICSVTGNGSVTWYLSQKAPNFFIADS